MIVNRSISLCILLNLILLCQGQRHHQTAQKPPNKMGEVLSFPENEEEDPAKKNAMVRMYGRCERMYLCSSFYIRCLYAEVRPRQREREV